MTDEELDLLASAYMDGEATPEEVALVERDPELQARVEAFRAVRVDETVTPPPGLIDRHLATAMAEFEGIASGPADGAGAPVVDLRAEAARRDGQRADGSDGSDGRADRRRNRPRRTMPSWLPAAAGFVIIGGGLIWAIGQTGGSGDDAASEADTAALATEDAATEEAAEADAGGADEAADFDTLTDEGEESEAMEESAADGAARSSAAEAEAPAPADGDDAADTADDEAAEDAEAGLVEPEPLLFFDEVPDPDTIEDLPEPEPDLERSLCGPEILSPSLGEPLGFIPIEIGGRPAELYLFLDGDGTEIRLLIDEDCLRIEP